MRKIVIIFMALLLVFVGTWIVKAQSPVARPDSYANGINADDGAWWNALGSTANIDEQWILDPEIPDNYLPVPGEDELYMVVDENGNILQYRQRIKQEDGSWVWNDVTTEIPDNYEPVTGLHNVYRVTDENGNTSYYQYIRNDDNTYAFVPVDENGNALNDNPPSDSSIPANYVHLSGNVYAVLNEHGVVIGYKERTLNADGTYSWHNTTKPNVDQGNHHTSYQPDSNGKLPEGNAGNSGGNGGNFPNNGTVTNQNSDGTYTETETIITTETSGGWVITYQTIVTRVYDAKGKLISTKKEGPTAISKTQTSSADTNAPDSSKIAPTLKAEVARMSTGIQFNTDLANQVLANLNAERAAQGLPTLKMAENDDAYLLAQARAAAMAAYNYSDYDSPLYGTLSNMLKKFGISSAAPSENTWKTTTSKSAQDIHNRFMVLDGAREARMNAQYTGVGIAVAQKNGYYYICEVFVN